MALIEHEVMEPSKFVLSKTRLPGIVSLYDLGKFMSAVLDSSKGELWVVDQWKPLFGLSIISFNLAWQSSNVLPTASIIESSTKPGDSLSGEETVSIRGAL